MSRRRSRSLRAPAVYPLAGYASSSRYFAVAGAPSKAKLALYGAVSLSAAVDRRLASGGTGRPAGGRGSCSRASQCVYFAGDVTFYTYHVAYHDTSYPAPADAIYLAHYPFLVAGIVLLAGRRNRQRGAFIDTLIVGAAFALLVWILLMDPYAHAAAGARSCVSRRSPIP